jgi:predicted nucleotidyltransferase
MRSRASSPTPRRGRGPARGVAPARTHRATRAAKANDRLSSALASGALAKLVSYFAVRPDDTPHLRALMRHTAMGARSFQLEFARLEQLGLLRRDVRPDGRVLIRATERRDLWAPFRALVRAYADPVDLLRLALIDLAGIEAAFVFGSMAGGTADDQSDVDLCVIARDGDDTTIKVLEHLLAQRTVEASLGIGREVNVVVVTASRLAAKLADGRGFYSRIVAGEKRWVLGDSRGWTGAMTPATSHA